MTGVQKTWLFIGLFVFVGLLYLLGPILSPFLIAALLAYISNPLVKRLVQIKIPRTLAVLMVFVFIILLIVVFLILLIPLFERQITLLIQKIPSFIEWLQRIALPWLSQHFGVEHLWDLQAIRTVITEHWQEATSATSTVIRTVFQSGYSLFALGLNLVLIPVVTFYFLRDWERVMRGLHKLLPRKVEPTVSTLVSDCDNVIGAFFRGQLMVMMTLAVIYSAGLWLMGLDVAVSVGFLIGILSVVPYLGFIVGIVIASLATVIQFHDWLHIGYLLIVFAVGNIAESYILMPLLVGDRVGLHPVTVIFAILAGGQLFGFIGILLAVPIAAIIMVLLRFATQRYLHSEWYSHAETTS